MKLADKIVGLRKAKRMSQEDLAEKLNLSRQAISRWEMGTAMPDATNILQLSKLFDVTTDYLLKDDCQHDDSLPKNIEAKSSGMNQILIWLVTLEIMVLLMQFMSTIILQSAFFGFLSLIPFVAIIGGFEWAYQRKASAASEATALFRKRFYKISAWLGLYFPIRFIATALAPLYPRPYSFLVFECVLLCIYIGASTLATLFIEKRYLIQGK